MHTMPTKTACNLSLKKTVRHGEELLREKVNKYQVKTFERAPGINTANLGFKVRAFIAPSTDATGRVLEEQTRSDLIQPYLAEP